MKFQNIPPELRDLPQWVSVGEDKRPLNPRTGREASVTDPHTWGTFQEACRGSRRIGFVLTAADPYCFIDLDAPLTNEQRARHKRIYNAFHTYAEVSQSGTGIHIICKARIPRGVRRDRVEVYSDARYMIMTGNVRKQLPVADAQDLVDRLFAEMDSVQRADLVDTEESITDQEVMRRAQGAENAEKFERLWNGDFSAWPSQSEADFALLSMLCFYSSANEQVRRLFRQSALGQRAKAQSDRYLNRCMEKIRGAQPAPVDVSQIRQHVVEVLDQQQPAEDDHEAPSDGDDQGAAPEPAKASSTLTSPPGLAGEIAHYIHETAVRPAPEIAVAAALALMAGIAGRSYNTFTGTGLNLYLIVLAETGIGKEGAANGIDRLLEAVRQMVPSVDEFMGPSAFASGQALVRCLDKHRCCLSLLGEFGLTLQNLCDPRASAPMVTLRKVLLDLYNKSGFTSVLKPSVYSDSEKNTQLVHAPNLTILGESTPGTFYDHLNEGMVEQGLLPRFLVIEHRGKRPKRNREAGIAPEHDLAKRVALLAGTALTMQQNNTCAPVRCQPDAEALLDAFDEEADAKINTTSQSVHRQLWNRAHVKALKVASLLAVGGNLHDPIIGTAEAEWAVELVRRDLASVLRRFQEGEIGSGDHRQESDVRRAVSDYLAMNRHQRKRYQTPDAILKEPLVPQGFLRRRLRMCSSFTGDRRGAINALATVLTDMVQNGTLNRVGSVDAETQFGVRIPLYYPGPTW